MALIRVAQYGSTPGPVTDYQAQNAHLQAFTNQLMTQQFILDAGTAQPIIKQGCYVSHGGSLYIADADTAITGSPSDGSVYIRVSGTTSLTVEFVTDISSYAWNTVYTALTSGSYTLLPYLIVKASSVWTRYNFNPNNQSFGAIIGASIDTGQGATEVHLMNQNLRTTDSPTFANYRTRTLSTAVDLDTIIDNGHYYVAAGGANNPSSNYCSLLVVGNSDIKSQTLIAIVSNKHWHRIGNSIGNASESWTAWRLIDQDLSTTASVHFANLNPPVDNNDATPPDIGIGGFTVVYVADDATYTLPATGTYIVLGTATTTGISRYAGGTVLTNNRGSSQYFMIFRIA